MAKKKVFISYDHDNDAHYKNLIAAWNANPNFEFEINTTSPKVAVNSTDAGPIKSALTTKLKQSEYLLVIVGSETSKSDWIKWEIDRAKQSDIKLKLAAVKIDKKNALPSGLTIFNTSIAEGFTEAGILAALDDASNTY